MAKKTKGVEAKSPALIDGSRFYPTPTRWKDSPWTHLPSVTTVLSNTESFTAQNRLAKWNKDWDSNPENEVKTKPTVRGSWVDTALSDYLKIHPDERMMLSDERVPEDVKSYIHSLNLPLRDGMSCVSHFGKCIWVQGLIDPTAATKDRRLFHGTSSVNKSEYLASRTWGYAGVPDILGEWNGVMTLVSLKTSEKPYNSTFRWTAFNASMARNEEETGKRKPSPEQSLSHAGFMKYKRACLQEAAYRLALRETLGIHIDNVLILVVTPPEVKGVQIFRLNSMQLQWAEEEWLKKVVEFHDKFGAHTKMVQ